MKLAMMVAPALTTSLLLVVIEIEPAKWLGGATPMSRGTFNQPFCTLMQISARKSSPN
jgi:hypothetical protein